MSTPFRIALFAILALLVVLPSPIQAIRPRKLDETTTSPPNDQIKCGSCPCGDIYPIVNSTSDAPRRFAAMQAVLVVFGLVGMICLW
ncbi:hypothetical protein CTI12_AA246110 [Artemisia annua]|uniref:Transmembrane protein n=1 Tax=Artemisia annua TaxID=35608 RepID=A0A2U1KLJ1_ARTAN|nr:hypothetical protein CTI12_AA588070 [Artemisia annua]PWA75029.1 hypothetical protein CTI12_AA246110 [Artemisia annua]